MRTQTHPGNHSVPMKIMQIDFRAWNEKAVFLLFALALSSSSSEKLNLSARDLVAEFYFLSLSPDMFLGCRWDKCKQRVERMIEWWQSRKPFWERTRFYLEKNQRSFEKWKRNIHTHNHLCAIHNALFPWAIHSTCSVDLIPCIIIVFDTKKRQHSKEKQSCFFITPEAFDKTQYSGFSAENHNYVFHL